MLSKPLMNDRTRFAKCFIIIVEECKSWLVAFAENRVKSLGYTSLKAFINAKYRLFTHQMIKSVINNTPLDLDVSALWVIIKDGKLLKTGELKTVGHTGKTIGDYVDRIREIRNNFMHTATANLEEQDYNDYLAEFKYIASRFETENTMTIGMYVKKIEKIDKGPLDSVAVERTVERYNTYIQYIVNTEFRTIPIDSHHNDTFSTRPSYRRSQNRVTIPDKHDKDSNSNCFTMRFPSEIAKRTRNPFVQAVGGFVGGTLGLVVDILTAPVLLAADALKKPDSASDRALNK